MNGLLRQAADRGVGEVIYLGDAFQYLIGMSKFWTEAVHQVLAFWRDLRSRGVRIVVIEGNRDFFLDHDDLADLIDWSGRRYDFQAGGRVFRLVHGDLVNRRDLQYRFWSTVSKSPPARLWARLLPKPVAVAIVRHMEARLARTNRKFRYVKPIADLERAAADAWSEGIDVILWGHFHTPWLHCRGHHIAFVMPAWLESRQGVLVESDGTWTLADEQLEPLGLTADCSAVSPPPGDTR
jgi:UDP-2,3-diacylglucosamine pyrophosphatase LpxH